MAELKDIKELYGAHVRFPKTAEEIVFNYSAMKIKKHYDTMLEMKYPYFTDRNNSTRYFEESMLDREYKITDELTVFYSADKGKCVDWLTEKRNAYFAEYRNGLHSQIFGKQLSRFEWFVGEWEKKKNE